MGFFSVNSFKNCFTINGICGILSYGTYICSNYFNNFFAMFCGESIKTFFLLTFMDKYAAKPFISDKNSENKESFQHELTLLTTSTIFVKTLTHWVLWQYLEHDTTSLIWFIPTSFMFELTFDFAHYWMHRAAHSHSFIYKNVHKKHHKYSSPSAITSFYMHPVDVVLSYSAPLVFTMMIFNVDKLNFALITTYLTYQEIGGHLGKKMSPTSSFAQCVWLPRMFDIELYTEEHDLHHKKSNCNYSKRFKIWDKLFKTYKYPKSHQYVQDVLKSK